MRVALHCLTVTSQQASQTIIWLGIPDRADKVPSSLCTVGISAYAVAALIRRDSFGSYYMQSLRDRREDQLGI
jgi:hypothetical protein